MSGKSQLIPNKAFWGRAEFLQARQLQYEAAIKRPTEPGEYIMEPDEDVICDWCNALIEDPMINLVDFGSRAVCDVCYQKHYAKEPMKYRVMNPDGTLGNIVQSNEE